MFLLCLESYNQILLSDNQEAEITLKIRVKNTSGGDITFVKGESIPPSLDYRIQAISSCTIISLASNDKGEEEEMNVVAGNYVEKLTKNVDDNDSMEYEESYEHRECDDNLMEMTVRNNGLTICMSKMNMHNIKQIQIKKEQ